VEKTVLNKVEAMTIRKKIVTVTKINQNRRIKRAYFNRIKDYFLKELSKIFDRHILSEAKVTTDKWIGYLPLKK